MLDAYSATLITGYNNKHLIDAAKGHAELTDISHFCKQQITQKLC